MLQIGKRIRQGCDSSNWLIKRLRLPVSKADPNAPGLLLIQIDGLSRREIETAFAQKRMPFLKRLAKSSHSMGSFYPGLPSSTPAVQSELYYGVKTAVPAFSFRDTDGQICSLFEPKRASALEASSSTQGRPLLKGGSSWSNIFSGGAEESHLCITHIGLGDIFRTKHGGSLLLFGLLNIVAVIRIMFIFLAELLLGIWEAIQGMLQGQRIPLELATLLSRTCVGIGMREVLRIGGKLDATRGLPIIHLNFLGYDEMAHRRGPDSGFARWSLRGIDGAIKEIYKAAMASPRRKYEVWIFSDHGQERVHSLETRYRGGMRQLVRDCLFPDGKEHAREAPPRRPLSRRMEARRAARPPKAAEKSDHPFLLAAMGPVAHLYFTVEVSDEEKHRRARILVEKGGVPAVAFSNARGGLVWHDDLGAVDGRVSLENRLGIYPPPLRREIAVDLERLCNHPCAGHLVLLGFNGIGQPRTFAAERGAHAGLGPREIEGFLLTPSHSAIARTDRPFIRPTDLRNAIFEYLDGVPLKVEKLSCG